MWKERVNDLLSRSTGYQLQRVQRSASAPLPAPTPPPGVPVPRSGRVKLPMHYDDDAKTTILRAGPRAAVTREKLFGQILATRFVTEHEVPGDIVECGVWRGGTMQSTALTLLESGDATRHLHLFDTFEGVDAEGRLPGDGTATKVVATLDDVREAMAELEYPPGLIHFHEGKVEDTIPAQAPDTIALLRLATDSYESTRHELEHLYDRLSPGGILIIDDYGRWDRARMATQEFAEHRRERLLLLPLGTGRVAVKPWP